VRGSLRQKAPGRWELRVPLLPDPISGERRRRSVTFNGAKRDAERELARLVAAAERDDATAAKATVASLLDAWWDQKRERLSPTTAREYGRIIERRLRPDLGKKRLDRLTAADLDAYYVRLEREGLGASSIRQLHAVLSGALRQAVKWRWLATSPARDATLPRATRAAITPPTPEQARTLLALADEHSLEIGMFIRLAAALGARRGEVCGLRWTDLDETAGTITIKRAVVDVAGKVHVKDTKTHAERTVTVDAGTLALLAAHHRAMSDRAAECGIVLSNDAYVLSPEPDGTKPLRPERATNVFRVLRQKAGVPEARLHDLRHFVATQLIGAGHDIRTVSGRLGHAKTSTTLDMYAAFLRPQDKAAADTLGSLLERDA
jgi:integrase